jgi:hypothetical protein
MTGMHLNCYQWGSILDQQENFAYETWSVDNPRLCLGPRWLDRRILGRMTYLISSINHAIGVLNCGSGLIPVPSRYQDAAVASFVEYFWNHAIRAYTNKFDISYQAGHFQEPNPASACSFSYSVGS